MEIGLNNGEFWKDNYSHYDNLTSFIVSFKMDMYTKVASAVFDFTNIIYCDDNS